jgi:hypothetical protein
MQQLAAAEAAAAARGEEYSSWLQGESEKLRGCD